jgi:hypothetical protein
MSQVQSQTKKSSVTVRVRKPRAPRVKANLCVCGCGTLCHKLFAAGHDQRVRGWMLRGEKLPATLTKAIAQGLVIEPVKPTPTVKLFARLPFTPKAKTAKSKVKVAKAA